MSQSNDVVPLGLSGFFAVCAILMAIVFTYTLGGIGTTRLHEHRFPGEAVMCETYNGKRDCFNGSNQMGFLWPIGLPITLAVYVADALTPDKQ
jgi:hypothetical protein